MLNLKALIAAFGLICAGPGVAEAQYPNKPVRIVVGYPAVQPTWWRG